MLPVSLPLFVARFPFHLFVHLFLRGVALLSCFVHGVGVLSSRSFKSVWWVLPVVLFIPALVLSGIGRVGVPNAVLRLLSVSSLALAVAADALGGALRCKTWIM